MVMQANFNALWALVTVCTIAALAAVTAAYLGIRLWLRNRAQFSHTEQIANLRNVLNPCYLDRRLTSVVDGYTHLRHLRHAIHSRLMRGNGGGLDSECWQDSVRRAAQLQGSEGVLAYESSLGLEQVGIWVLSGGLPLDVTLELAGKLIIRDWAYCHELVATRIRRFENELERKHAEWLACMAAIYFKVKNYDSYLSEILGVYGGDFDRILETERRIRIEALRYIPSARLRRIEQLTHKSYTRSTTWSRTVGSIEIARDSCARKHVISLTYLSDRPGLDEG